MAMKQHEFRIGVESLNLPEEVRGRLDRFLAHILGRPRSWVRGIIDHGFVQVNGERCDDGSRPLQQDDLIAVRFDPSQNYREKARPIATRGFEVLYQDTALIVVQKDAGVLTVPTDRAERNTLLDLLRDYLRKTGNRAGSLSTVHRLDRETSGLLVFGLKAQSAQALIQQFAARKPHREYVALVAGRVAKDEGKIESFLQTDSALNQKSAEQGELAITRYRVVRRFRDATELRLQLETGRRNQIRVHLSEQGHPVLGDTRYQPSKAKHPFWPYGRLALHAESLGFLHPETAKELKFHAPVPAEFAHFEARMTQSQPSVP